MIPPAQPPQAQEGFILIEVLVSALILAIVAGAVLTLITATTRSAASQRTHAVAYDLAQEDQARLRTMPISKLNGLLEENIQKTVGGTTYSVTEEGVYVNNKANGISCAAGEDSADYIQLTSTVSSAAMLHPIKIQSIVSPSGSINPNLGTLAAQTTNAAEEPVTGVTVELSGPASRQGMTAVGGCANFAEIPVGSYTVVFKSSTLITPEVKHETPGQKVEITGTRDPERAASTWDKPSTLEPEFVYLEPGTETLLPAPVDSMSVVAPGGSATPTVFGTPSGARSSTLVDSPVFPFKSSKYTIYAGSCPSNNPEGNTSTEDEAKEAIGIDSIEVKPGETAKPRIRVPALELTVTNGSGHPVSGAMVTVTDTNCKVERIFTTNKLGHIASSAEGETKAVGLPFSTYEICVSATINKELFGIKAPAPVAVKDFAAATPVSLTLTKGATECP